MKQNGMRLENKTPREITNMERKMSSFHRAGLEQNNFSSNSAAVYEVPPLKAAKTNRFVSPAAIRLALPPTV